MAFKRNIVSLGPYTRHQKLYLETDDGVAMEGEFVKFNSTQTTILLHRVELIPPDGRIFDQYNADVCELVCLHPLGTPIVDVNLVTNSVAEKPEAVPENSIGRNFQKKTEVENSVEARQKKAEEFEARRMSLRERLHESGLIKEIHPDVLKTLETPFRTLTCKNNSVAKPPVVETREAATSSKPETLNKREKSPEKTDQQPQMNGEKVQPALTNLVYEALKSKAKGYIIVDKLGPLLQQAMEDIEKRSILGLGGHGAEKGRLDRLSLLTIATESAVYLIDIQALGAQALQKRLVTVLESHKVEKVTYDCRYLSDCLYYSHRVRLQNVYDVQAADCVMTRCRRGTFPKRGRSLQELVVQYLDLPAALLVDKNNITNYKVWYQRPLPEGLYDFAAWQVVPLHQIRVAIDNAFQNLMRTSFDVYLNFIRKMHRSDAAQAQHFLRQIPVALLDAPFTRDA